MTSATCLWAGRATCGFLVGANRRRHASRPGSSQLVRREALFYCPIGFVSAADVAERESDWSAARTQWADCGLLADSLARERPRKTHIHTDGQTRAAPTRAHSGGGGTNNNNNKQQSTSCSHFSTVDHLKATIVWPPARSLLFWPARVTCWRATDDRLVWPSNGIRRFARAKGGHQTRC